MRFFRRESGPREALFRCQRGNVALLFALSLPVVVGASGFGVETTYLYHKKSELQASADAASHAAATERRSGGALPQVRAVAVAVAQENGFDGTDDAVEVNTPPVSGLFVNQNAVEVILSETTPRFFTALFAEGDVHLNARAVAEYRTASNACVLALDASAARAAEFSGNARAKFTGCSVMANSTASDAIDIRGSAQLETTCVISGGGTSTGTAVTLTECKAPILHAPPVMDPFRDLVQPATTGGCQTSTGAALNPGRYCGGLRLTGKVTLSPGVYVVSGGDFRVNANAMVHGEGVTIFLEDNAQTSINGSASLALSAPTSGPYAGVLFFGDRNGTGSSKFNGTATSYLTGSIYMPTRAVTYSGNFSGQNGCMQVVANTVQWSGSTDVSVDCSAYGMRPMPALTVVRVVE